MNKNTQTACCKKCEALDQVDQNPTQEICINPNCPCHAPQDTDKGWEERFDERFHNDSFHLLYEEYVEIKAFIYKTLASEIKRAEDRVVDKFKQELDEVYSWLDTAYTHGRRDAEKAVEELKEEIKF